MTAHPPNTGGDVAAEAATRAAADTSEAAARAAADALLAPLASPALTGAPTAPKATSGTNTTQIASTSFVHDAVAAASLAAGSRPSRVYDVIADGGADPTTAPGREVWSIIDAAITAGNGPIYLPPNVQWTLDTATHGPLRFPAGLGITGPNGGLSYLNAKPDSNGGPVSRDLIQLRGDHAYAANLYLLGIASLLTTSTSGSFSADPAATGFTLNVSGGDAAAMPTSGAGYILAIGTNTAQTTPTLRLTYTTKSSLGGGVYQFSGCDWYKGEAALWLYKTWTIGAATSVALYPASGCGIRCLNDSQFLNLDNIFVDNHLDGFCFGDDANWKVARVNMTATSGAVTWVSGDTFPNTMGATTWVSVVGASATQIALGSNTTEVAVASWTDSHHITLDTVADVSVTNAVMVWGGSAASQGGGGGATFSSMTRYFGNNLGRFGVALFTDTDHPDLGNYKIGHGRITSKYGHTGFLNRASGVQGVGGMKFNGFNRGYDLGNGAPGTPSGSSTANFNFDVLATESHAINGLVLGDTRHPIFPCVSTIAGYEIDKVKLQLAGSVDRYPLLIDAGAETIFIDKIYALNTSGASTAFAYIRGGDSIDIGAIRIKGNKAFSHIFLRSLNATNVNLTGPVMLTANNFADASGYLYKCASVDDGSVYDAPSAAFIEGQILPADKLPSFYIKTGLAAASGGAGTGGLATLWRFTFRQQRGFVLNVYGRFSVNNLGVTIHRQIVASKDTSGGAPTFTVYTPVADVGTGIAPTISMTSATASPVSTLALTIQNAAPAGTLTGRVWAEMFGSVVAIEVAGPGAGISSIGGVTDTNSKVVIG